MQTTLQDVSYPHSSLSSSSNQSSKCVEKIPDCTEFSDSVLGRSTLSSSVCGSVQSLNNLHTKQSKIYESFGDIRSYHIIKNNYLFWIKNKLLFEIGLIVLDGSSKTQAITMP